MATPPGSEDLLDDAAFLYRPLVRHVFLERNPIFLPRHLKSLLSVSTVRF